MDEINVKDEIITAVKEAISANTTLAAAIKKALIKRGIWAQIKKINNKPSGAGNSPAKE